MKQPDTNHRSGTIMFSSRVPSDQDAAIKERARLTDATIAVVVKQAFRYLLAMPVGLVDWIEKQARVENKTPEALVAEVMMAERDRVEAERQ